VPAPRACASESGEDALADKVSLELGDGHDNVKQ
jgi:hypothetical protein